MCTMTSYVWHRYGSLLRSFCHPGETTEINANNALQNPISAPMSPSECTSILQPHLQAAYAAAQGAYASSSSSADDGNSRELDVAVSDTSLDCESPRPPPGGSGLGRSWGSEDIIGACRTTVLRGESDVAGSSLAIVGCHEASVYVLAPLKHVLVSCCVDCTIVVRFQQCMFWPLLVSVPWHHQTPYLMRALQIGACGGSLRMEQCERMQIVSAAVRTTISTCRDSTMHIACNTQPLLSGDNRFIQLAPFNTAYEHLPRHLRAAGVARVPFHWSSPLAFSRDPYKVRIPLRVLDHSCTKRPFEFIYFGFVWQEFAVEDGMFCAVCNVTCWFCR